MLLGSVEAYDVEGLSVTVQGLSVRRPGLSVTVHTNDPSWEKGHTSTFEE